MRRERKARVNLAALDSATVRLQLFDDAWLTVSRTSEHHPASDKAVWVGRGEDGSQAVLTVVRGVLTGTVFFDHRTFEITVDPDGQYTVAELDPAAFPTDDPIGLPPPDVLDAPVEEPVALPMASAAAGGGVQVDAMIVWTPTAEAYAGGRAAMESLALASVANANLVYANSGINAQLNLVYAAPVSYTETGIANDLGALRGSGDGLMDQVHTLRTQYGADLVTLIGEGYRGGGSCGIAYQMTTVSTSFAGNAFSVVDRTCAVGNLSFAHELGHNQGLHHDTANAGSSGAYSYAYGYQSPSGLFRTLMAYGSAVRIPFLSSPSLSYSGWPTGTQNENNARALTNTVSTVAAFKATTSSPAPPSCTYSVSTTSIAFTAAGGSTSVSVTAPSGCIWQATNDTGASWVGLSTAGGSGNGAVTVTATANTGAARSTTVTIAGWTVAVNEGAAATPPVSGGGVNVAAASAGATATASSADSGFGAAGAINGDRWGVNWGANGGWQDGTPGAFPDWLQIDFAGAKTITEVRVFSVQDNYAAPVDPTPTQLFSQYGVTSFTVQYWDGAQWQVAPGGAITGNQHVWRTVTFPALTTAHIRVLVTGAADTRSRIAEVEAIAGEAAPTCTYAVSTTSIAFLAAGGSQSVSVTAPSGCSWQTANDAAASWVSLSTSGGTGNGTVTVNAAANAGAARNTTVTIAGWTVAVGEAAAAAAPPASGGVNVAAASAGATATASSADSGFGVAGAINGDRAGINWGANGGWQDGTPGAFPDWLQIDFAGAKTITEVRVFSVQDNYAAPVDPTPTQLFSQYGVTSFTVQYWDGAQWLVAPGGTITGNQHVWRTVTFPALTTAHIRVLVTGAVDIRSRIAEVEAIAAGEAAPPVAPGATGNVAAASAGATATASSADSGFGVAGAINGDRAGINWGANGGWQDGTPGDFPDWLQIDFAGARTITEVRLFSIQDNYATPVDPSPTQSFSLYGVTSFTVQYWDGTQWLTVPGGVITGNQHVWRTVTFPALTTAHIRVLVTGATDIRSRIAEVEAY